MTRQRVSRFAVPLAAVLFLLGPAAPAFAQQAGLVNVDISNIKVDIARDINVDVSQIPVTVQAPIAVAANVCDIDVNVLTDQATKGGANCQAKSTSAALNEIVQQQVSTQK